MSTVAIAKPPTTTVAMPRWTFRTSLMMNDTLAALGMPTALDAGSADFSGMTQDEALFISAVAHQAFIAVDEEGTEAAAATAVVMSATSMPMRTALTLDHSFVFVIHDTATLTPLFIGRVDDPS